MTKMQILWAAIGLSIVGFILIWYGANFEEIALWVGLVVFSIGMLMGPLSRYVGLEEQEE